MASERRASMLAPVVAAFADDLIETAALIAAASPGGRLDPPLGLFLDEVANIVPLPQLPALMSFAGGTGIFVAAVFQSMAQARNRWGADAAAMLWGASTVKAILGGLAGEDLREISELAGEYRETVVSWQRGHGGSSLTSSLQDRKTLTPQEIRTLSALEREGLIIHATTPAVKTRMTRHYEGPHRDVFAASERESRRIAGLDSPPADGDRGREGGRPPRTPLTTPGALAAGRLLAHAPRNGGLTSDRPRTCPPRRAGLPRGAPRAPGPGRHRDRRRRRLPGRAHSPGCARRTSPIPCTRPSTPPSPARRCQRERGLAAVYERLRGAADPAAERAGPRRRRLHGRPARPVPGPGQHGRLRRHGHRGQPGPRRPAPAARRPRPRAQPRQRPTAENPRLASAAQWLDSSRARPPPGRQPGRPTRLTPPRHRSQAARRTAWTGRPRGWPGHWAPKRAAWQTARHRRAAPPPVAAGEPARPAHAGRPAGAGARRPDAPPRQTAATSPRGCPRRRSPQGPTAPCTSSSASAWTADGRSTR